MKTVTFQVVEGIDKGRIYRDLAVPVTIGREEGNVLRLNDERVSRFHAKIQLDSNEVILTDLESTNGTRINGNPIQIRRLRAGDRVNLGRSTLVFGSNEEIRARIASMQPSSKQALAASPPTIPGDTTYVGELEPDLASMTQPDEVEKFWSLSDRDRPALPAKLSPSQSARLAELLDFLHRGLGTASENLRTDETGSIITLSFADWQKIQGVQMLMARYLRAVAEPDLLEQ